MKIMVRSFFVLCVIMLVFQCKKKDASVECSSNDPLEHFNGNFLCEIDDYSSYSYDNSSSHKTYDQVVRCSAENDSVKIFIPGEIPIEFRIDSVSQTYFSREEISTTEQYVFIELSFSESYESFAVSRTNHNANAPSYGTSVEGVRTELNVSELPHSNLSDLQGQYVLETIYKHYSEGINVQLMDTFWVTKEDHTVFIGDQEEWMFSFPLFHSFAETESSHFASTNHDFHKSIHWLNDSLDIEYYSRNGYYDDLPEDDTLFYSLRGTKLY